MQLYILKTFETNEILFLQHKKNFSQDEFELMVNEFRYDGQFQSNNIYEIAKELIEEYHFQEIPIATI